MQHLNGAQKKYIYRHYDQFVKNNSVVIPGEADACVLAPIKGCDAGVAVTIDSNTYGTVDPYVAGAYAVAESIRNIIAVGATPIALTDCLNYGNPENPDVFYDFQEGVRGIGDAAKDLVADVVPIISGNVSFYNESKTGQAVVPSPVICCIGRMDHADQATRMQLSNPGSRLCMIGYRYPEFAATQVAQVLTETFSTTPQVRFDEEKEMNLAMFKIQEEKLLTAVHDISQGGLIQAVIEMIGGDRNWPVVGVNLHCPNTIDPFSFLYSESGGYLFEVSEENLQKVEAICNSYNVIIYDLGEVTNEQEVVINSESHSLMDVSVTELLKAWNSKNLVTVGTPIYNNDLKE